MPAAAPAPIVTNDFNITIQLGNNEQNVVTLYAADFDKVATQGLHFALPAGSSVNVGSLRDLLEWINGRLTGVGAPKIPIEDNDLSILPNEIRAILTGVLDVTMTVTKFTFDLGPKGADKQYPKPEFSLAVTGGFAADGTTGKAKSIPFGGVFSVVGGGIGVSYKNPPVSPLAALELGESDSKSRK